MIYDVAVTLIDKIGPKTVSILLDALGSAKVVMQAPYEQLVAVEIPSWVAKSISAHRNEALAQAQRHIDQCQAVGVTILVRGSEHYPKLLAECPDAPHVIYVRGFVNFNASKLISVVGTRAATQQGVAHTSDFVKDVSRSFPEAVIVSGLAFGIDKAAHVAAIENGLPTVAVMAGWVDDIVPRSHYGVARKILSSNGAIVSDMPPGTTIKGGNFLSRNRIIAGMSSLTVVVESAAKGGSLVTADIALSYDRELFAMPGRIGESEYQGTNALIKSNKATLYQDISDIASTMGWTRAGFKAQNPSTLPDYLLETFVVMPDTEPFTLDYICEGLDIAISEASSRMIQLEIRGFVKSIQGRLYQKAKY